MRLKSETPLLALLVAAHTGDRELVALAVRAAADVVEPAGFASFVAASKVALSEAQHEWLTNTLRGCY